jgi:hypothetical protein
VNAPLPAAAEAGVTLARAGAGFDAVISKGRPF